MHVDTTRFSNDGEQIVVIALDCEVQLYDWSGETRGDLMINTKRISKTKMTNGGRQATGTREDFDGEKFTCSFAPALG